MKKLAILGAGSWGLTLAWLNSEQSKYDVVLWDRSPEKIKLLQQNRHVTFPVEVTLPDNVQLTADLSAAISEANVILMVVTANGTRDVAVQIRKSAVISKQCIVVNCSKGIEFPSLERISDVLSHELPDNPNAILSGPSLAKELLRGLPTACSVAAKEKDIAEYLQQNLSHNQRFRLYSNTDITGVELGGSLKNIFAIPSGYMQAKHLGDNAQASLITRGLAEMTRFSVALGANPETLYGLSGLGDLLATCNSPLSRNYQVGARLAQGEKLDDILTDLKVVAEGVKTTFAVSEIAKKIGLEMPIVNIVKQSFEGKISERDIIHSLMSRKLKAE